MRKNGDPFFLIFQSESFKVQKSEVLIKILSISLSFFLGSKKKSKYQILLYTYIHIYTEYIKEID